MISSGIVSFAVNDRFTSMPQYSTFNDQLKNIYWMPVLSSVRVIVDILIHQQANEVCTLGLYIRAFNLLR
ncbi:hypothetical protein A3Q56_01316 [Intoshia linei]|uniref:Uncharacterized protein n=1 Tax=Intoshia linei TaxID=1819745 RepID=A0A177B9H5_9BILA|nr:hypothetical protein A3Q56_01316 [Intoshia linei]